WRCFAPRSVRKNLKFGSVGIRVLKRMRLISSCVRTSRIMQSSFRRIGVTIRGFLMSCPFSPPSSRVGNRFSQHLASTSARNYFWLQEILESFQCRLAPHLCGTQDGELQLCVF